MSRPVVPVRVPHVILSAVLSLVWLGEAGPVLAQPDHPMAAIGRIPGHGTLSTFPWEHVDSYTGNVLLSFTDLVLPGNAGFNLVVQRTFNSKGESLAVHLGPLTGKLIAFHVGGER